MSRQEQISVPGHVYDTCRRLRVEDTPAEHLLWEVLRDRRLAGWQFRRQHPLGHYVADIYCAAAHLVIELGGSVHQVPNQQAYDRVRDEELSAHGLRVLRLSNEDIQQRLTEAVRRILVLLPLST